MRTVLSAVAFSATLITGCFVHAGPRTTFDAWVEAYGSDSLLLAYNKNSDFKIDGLSFQRAIQQVQVPPSRSAQYMLQQTVRDVKSERHQAIVENVASYVATADADEMVIVFTGALHALDLSLSDKLTDGSVLYLFPPLREKSEFADVIPEITRLVDHERNAKNSASADQMLLRLDHLFRSTKASELGHSVHDLFLFSAMTRSLLGEQYLSSGKRNQVLKRLQSPFAARGRPQVIVFADVHGLREHPQIEAFPVHDLKQMGFRKVTFLIEPHATDEKLSGDDIRAHARLSNYFATQDGFLRKLNEVLGPRAAENFLKTDFEIFPANGLVANLGSKLTDAGFEVRFRGVEKPGVVDALLEKEYGEKAERLGVRKPTTCEQLFK